MPKAKKKPVKPIVPTPPPPAPEPTPTVPPGREVIYDYLEIEEYSVESDKGPVDVQWCKDAMGWETESEYQTRKVAEFPDTKPAAWLFGDVYHCKNTAGEKVRTNNNANNRPFDMDWCEHLIHTILHGQWAGPFTMPGETVNGETIRISRYGEVLSAQHQMTACILAGERLRKAREDGRDHPDDPLYPVWRTHGEPFIETVVIKGLSEDPRVLMTIDYVKPRTAADVFYTSPVFKSCTAPERKELCRMLASAVDLLWTRTDTKGYRTHPEIVGLLERHKRLLRCVEHLFAENGAGRKISKLRLQPGHCSALMYLMACGSETTTEYSDEYRNGDPPSEKGLDWSLWERAEEFWTLIGDSRDFLQVRHALGRLVESKPEDEDNQGMGGRGPEKLALLAAAWERWRDHHGNGPPFDDSDLEPDGCLCLHYTDLDPKGNKLPDNKIDLVEVADFGGIDCPVASGRGPTSKAPPMPPPPTREEIERATEEAHARRAAARK